MNETNAEGIANSPVEEELQKEPEIEIDDLDSIKDRHEKAIAIVTRYVYG